VLLLKALLRQLASLFFFRILSRVIRVLLLVDCGGEGWIVRAAVSPRETG
jgi:hypothetical protein